MEICRSTKYRVQCSIVRYIAPYNIICLSSAVMQQTVDITHFILTMRDSCYLTLTVAVV